MKTDSFFLKLNLEHFFFRKNETTDKPNIKKADLVIIIPATLDGRPDHTYRHARRGGDCLRR